MKIEGFWLVKFRCKSSFKNVENLLVIVCLIIC